MAKSKTVIKKTEMKNLFKKEGLNLSFPIGATKGNEVTDWNYWYNKDYANSDLKKLVEIIKKKYSAKYKTSNSITGGSILVNYI